MPLMDDVVWLNIVPSVPTRTKPGTPETSARTANRNDCWGVLAGPLVGVFLTLRDRAHDTPVELEGLNMKAESCRKHHASDSPNRYRHAPKPRLAGAHPSGKAVVDSRHMVVGCRLQRFIR
jgi:hypothetical protein